MNQVTPAIKPNPMRIRIAFLIAVCLLFVCASSRWVLSQCGGLHPAKISIQHDFASGSLKAWDMPFPEDWEILQQGNLHYLHMKLNREPLVPRRRLHGCRIRLRRHPSLLLRPSV